MREAVAILADQADDLVAAYRKRLGELAFMGPYSGQPGRHAQPQVRCGVQATVRPVNHRRLHPTAGRRHGYPPRRPRRVGARHTPHRERRAEESDRMGVPDVRGHVAVAIPGARGYVAWSREASLRKVAKEAGDA